MPVAAAGPRPFVQPDVDLHQPNPPNTSEKPRESPYTRLADRDFSRPGIYSHSSEQSTDSDKARLEELDRKIEKLVQKLQKMWSGWAEQGVETVESIATELKRTISERNELGSRVKELEIDLIRSEKQRKLMLRELLDKVEELEEVTESQERQALELYRRADRIDAQYHRMRYGAIGAAVMAVVNVYCCFSPEAAGLMFLGGMFGGALLGDGCRQPMKFEKNGKA